MSKAKARLIIKGLVELEVERAAAQASAILGESVNSDVDNWEPYEEDDERDPVEPFYVEQDLREAAARRAARKKAPAPLGEGARPRGGLGD